MLTNEIINVSDRMNNIYLRTALNTVTNVANHARVHNDYNRVKSECYDRLIKLCGLQSDYVLAMSYNDMLCDTITDLLTLFYIILAMRDNDFWCDKSFSWNDFYDYLECEELRNNIKCFLI